MYAIRTFGVTFISLIIVTAPVGGPAAAQSLFLSPDTVRICSGSEEVFVVELRADAQVTDMNLYTVFIHFDPDLLSLYYVTDTTYWQCLGWQVDSTCADSLPTAWSVDSLCLNTECAQWQIGDSLCLDSIPAWDIDTTCTDWFFIWRYDSLCTDSVVTEWRVDSTCLNWQCTAWNEYNECIDSLCLGWEVDSVALEYLCTNWQVDTVLVDSFCTAWQVDSSLLGWTCTQWQIDSTCTDSVCTQWFYDSTATAWECTAWILDSICYDSVVSTPGNSDFFTVDTVEYAVTEGPLMHPPQAQSVPFYSRLTKDGSQLIIESLIFWPRIGVDGPGLLATIKMKNIASGIHGFSIDSIKVTDTVGTVLPVTGRGNILLLNPPPDSFNLRTPAQGSVIKVNIGDSLTFTWQHAKLQCLNDSVLYTLAISDEPTFESINTLNFADIKDTFLTLDPIATLWYGSVYWKVIATNSFGQTLGTPSYRVFTLDILVTPPGQFGLTSPRNDTLVNVTGKTIQPFLWTPSSTTIPNDTLRYGVHFWIGSPTPGGEEFIVNGLLVNHADVAIGQFQLYEDYTWRVKCTNRYGMSTWSAETFALKFYRRGDANSDGLTNVGDVVFLINYIFKGGPAPAFSQLGDASCDAMVNVGDAVYLVNFIFKGGSAPCAN
jgi:hypothetical protein